MPNAHTRGPSVRRGPPDASFAAAAAAREPTPRVLAWQLQGVCQQVADKCHQKRGPNAMGPPTKVDYANKSFDEIEAENDAYFGLENDEQLEDVMPPPRAKAAAAAAAAPSPPARAPAPRTPAPASPASGLDKDGRLFTQPSRVQVCACVDACAASQS